MSAMARIPCVKTDTCGCNSTIGCSLAGHTRHGHTKINPTLSQAGMSLTVYHVFLVKLSFHPAQLCIRIRSSKLDGTHESLPLRITVKVVFIERHITLGRYKFTLLVFVTKGFLLEDRCARLSLTSITFAPLSYVHKSPIKAAQNEHKSARIISCFFTLFVHGTFYQNGLASSCARSPGVAKVQHRAS